MQAELAVRLIRTHTATRPNKAVLAGLLRDSNGNRTVATHSKKSGFRYRYYQSGVLGQRRKEEAGVVSRVPAYEIERAVCQTIMPSVYKLSDGSAREVDPIKLCDRISQIEVLASELKITMNAKPLIEDEHQPANEHQVWGVPWSKPSAHRRKKLLNNKNRNDFQRSMRTETRARLIKGNARAGIWFNHFVTDPTESIDLIATREGVSQRSVRSTLSLFFLAPDIAEAE